MNRNDIEVTCPDCDGSGRGPTRLMREFLGATLTDKRDGSQATVVAVSEGGTITLDDGRVLTKATAVKHFEGQRAAEPVEIAYYEDRGWIDSRSVIWGYRRVW